MLQKDWSVIDKRVALFTDEDAETYEKLVALLEPPLKNDLDRDLYITRGLLVWLHYNIKHRTGKIAVDSPLGIATSLFQHSSASSYADAFTKLCRKAKLVCETVEGIAKNDTFEPGDFETNKLKSCWNKVQLNGYWWFVHPYWCLVTKVDQRNQSSTTNPRKAKINEFWFLTEPDVFIIKCFPDNPKNQHLRNSQPLKRTRQFMKLAFLTPSFFDYGLSLASEDSCVIDTVDGKAKIAFKADKAKSELICCYSLKDDQRTDASYRVFMSRKKRRFTFEILCPKVGSYQLVIYGRYPFEQEANVLLKAKIVCRERMSVYRPLPLTEIGETGWGFGSSAYKMGLYNPLIKTPKIVLPRSVSGTDIITFKIQKKHVNDIVYKAGLYSANKSSPLEGCVTPIKDAGKCELRISVTLPKEDEFALVIEARDQNTSFEPICNYLITVVEDKDQVEDYYYDSSDGTSDLDENVDGLEDERKRLQAKKDQLRRANNRIDKCTSTEPEGDNKTVKQSLIAVDDSPLPIYMLEMFLALLAVCVAVLRMLTFGAFDRL